ncbi:hypothetical protein KL86PLE_40772 [uncultured Pleomorphomonas sp.]|uniref:Uncharacterized protein n=2 Tax=uncultured Pleomorphomonas sp. TaxID=442121 RepID=A0A212LHK8_9HYPH|nr:hypothetical protein KL86PLE_40772 [uncultured Pleomorphomonas sp.]
MPQTPRIDLVDDDKGHTMNLHARNIEPDLGPLLDLTDDLPDQDASGYGKTEPRLEADDRKKPGLAFGPMDRIGPESPLPAEKPSRRDSVAAAPSGSALLTAWGGFWRAVVIGIVSGTVGGVVGAFTLVWLTGAGWSVFAKLLVDAIGHL